MVEKSGRASTDYHTVNEKKAAPGLLPGTYLIHVELSRSQSVHKTLTIEIFMRCWIANSVSEERFISGIYFAKMREIRV